MGFLKRAALTFLCLLGAATTLTIVKELGRHWGTGLGAIPTLIVILPWFILIHRIWFGTKRPDKRTELTKRLREMIDDPATPSDKREIALEKLQLLEKPGAPK